MRPLASLICAALAALAAAPAMAAPPTEEPTLVPQALDTYRGARKSGGPGKDGIPSIDDPKFQDAEAASEYLDDGDIVIGVYRDGIARAYPQGILVWHEIVNDTVAGKPLSITYCPLTATALGFERGATEFGVSGKLINSNLVMYDRATDSEYPQILATGIAGPNAGKGLAEVRVFWTEWGDWRARHPDTQVLSTETSFMRDYQRDPYGDYNPRKGYYAEGSGVMFPVLNEDGRYDDKHIVLGFRHDGQAVAVDKQALREAGVLHYSAGGDDYLVVHDPGLDTGWVYSGADGVEVDPTDIEFTRDGPRFDGRDRLERVNAFEAMWFAWSGFYPDTVVIDG